MEQHHVLILCQRKTGVTFESNKYNVEDTIVPQIENMVHEILGDNVEIKYLTHINGSSGTADFDLLLDNKSADSISFIEEHTNKYSMIVLNTCPFMFMDLQIIHNLLKPDGILVLSSFSALREGSNIKNIHKDLRPFFYKFIDQDYSKGIFYIKMEEEKGGRKTKRRRRRRNKKTRRNNKKKNRQ